MNIFSPYDCPNASAVILDDQRVCKMIVESAQLLSGAIDERVAPYKRTHINHPAMRAVRESGEVYNWTLRHFEALLSEYSERFDKVHKCAEHLATFVLEQPKTPYPTSLSLPMVVDTDLVRPQAPLALESMVSRSMTIREVSYRRALLRKWSTGKKMPRWYQKGYPVTKSTPWVRIEELRISFSLR